MRDDDLWNAYTKNVIPIRKKSIELPSRAKTPRVLPRADRHLDLHGMTVNDAWKAVKNHVLDTALNGDRQTLIITGFSGAIRKEFPKWIETLPRIREAIPTHGNGAFLLKMKKRRKI